MGYERPMGEERSLATQRYVALVNELRGPVPKRGWQSRIADQLGIHQSHLSKLLKPGSTIEVGEAIVNNAIRALGLSPTYFTQASIFDEESQPSFRDYVNPTSGRWKPEDSKDVLRAATDAHRLSAYRALGTGHGVSRQQILGEEPFPETARAKLVAEVTNLPIFRLAAELRDAPTDEVATRFVALLNEAVLVSSAAEAYHHSLVGHTLMDWSPPASKP